MKQQSKETLASTQLYQVANTYLDNAVAAGEVTESHIYYDSSAQKIAGFTDTTTASDVRIVRLSDGGIVVTADLEEQNGDVFVGAQLLPNQPPVVYERREVRGREHSTNLKHQERESAMAELAILISQEW